jgi:hypothetical protein
MCPVEAKATRTNNIVVYKPEADEWESAQSSNDGEYVLEVIDQSL